MESFVDWCKESELSEDTMKVLDQNGFNSLKSCKLLNSTLINKHFGKIISLGQILLLQEAVEKLNKTHSEDSELKHIHTDTQGTTQQADTAEGTSLNTESLLQMIGEASASNAPAATPHGKANVFDPFDFELCEDGPKTKLREIKNFITLFQEVKDKATVKLGDVELSLPESKPRLESISPLQYMEASLKILRDMVIADGIPVTVIMEYVGYLIKIANMGQRFHWRSVIKYDTEYRKAQASANFKWGADNAYMMQLFLREHVKPPQRQDGFQHRNKIDPNSGRVICGRFNGKQGCLLSQCKFAHVCLTCLEPSHGDYIHKQNTAKFSSEPKN